MRSERLKPFLEGSVRIFQYPSSQAHHGPVIFIIDMYIFSIGPWMISKCFQSLQFPHEKLRSKNDEVFKHLCWRFWENYFVKGFCTALLGVA